LIKIIQLAILLHSLQLMVVLTVWNHYNLHLAE
jgi:hypothetical protein